MRYIVFSGQTSFFEKRKGDRKNMFRRPFAYQAYGGDDWEGWTPPWERHHGPRFRGPRFFARRMRRGFFGPGGPFGPFGEEDPRGDPRWGAGRRFFGRGDVKYAVLE